ncbi:hypothetical protein IP69_20130 [Bosea sp. AAP35]|uniref:hypothetical protein n=1 Tax=Bosea sp. AAP35 TaxID=1523417 RepID=UPI0006B91D04|nr:hypothetical protein [Bosea sp. AAP35]KPF62765.1 hypothetical protein IP69_20130 [Bosea sp. AAP35]
MSIKIAGFGLAAALTLGGCQTVQQAAEAKTKLVCFQAGFGETSPRHDECMRTMRPVAQQIEMRQRLDGASEGLDMIAAGIRRR